MKHSQLAIKVSELIWSAIHSPSNNNHPGQKALDLLKNVFVNSHSKSLLDDFETQKKYSSSILTELENSLIENEDLNNQLLAIVKSAPSQAFKHLPYDAPTNVPSDFGRTNDSGGISIWAIIAVILLLLRILLKLLKD